MSTPTTDLIRASSRAESIGRNLHAAYWAIQSREILKQSAHADLEALAEYMGYRIERIEPAPEITPESEAAE